MPISGKLDGRLVLRKEFFRRAGFGCLWVLLQGYGGRGPWEVPGQRNPGHVFGGG